MKLLVVSHACANPSNQLIYAEIQRLTGWQFTLLLPSRWKDEFGNVLPARLHESFSATLVPAHVLGDGNIILHVYRYKLEELLLREKFDAIYVNHEPYGLATAQLCLVNRRTLRVPFGIYSCQNIVKRYPPPFRWIEQWVFRHSQFAFPITQAVADVFRAKGYRGSLTVAPLPLDPVHYRPRPDSKHLDLPQQAGEILIGYVGRIVEAKGLKTLINALVLIDDQPWKLVVIGSGPFDREFAALISQSGLAQRVIRLGYVPHEETPHYLARFDLLVVPSETQPNWKEQFGRVIVEAMACGTPVVGSDSGEIPNLIRSSGGGIVFPERNAEALAGALRQMIAQNNARQSFADQGRRWVAANVSLNAVAGAMIASIKQALARYGNRLERKWTPASKTIAPKPSR